MFKNFILFLLKISKYVLSVSYGCRLLLMQKCILSSNSSDDINCALIFKTTSRGSWVREVSGNAGIAPIIKLKCWISNIY